MFAFKVCFSAFVVCNALQGVLSVQQPKVALRSRAKPQNSKSQGTKLQGSKSQGIKPQGSKSEGIKPPLILATQAGERQQKKGTKAQGIKAQGTKTQGTKTQGIKSQGNNLSIQSKNHPIQIKNHSIQSLKRPQSMLDLQINGGNRQNMMKSLSSTLKELEKKRLKSMAKLQASYEKKLQGQNRNNKATKKLNEILRNTIVKLQKQNADISKKADQVTKKNENLLQTLKERKDNITAALAFALTSEETFSNYMQNSSVLGVLDEVKAKQAPSGEQTQKKRPVQSLLQQSGTIDETLDIHKQLEAIVAKVQEEGSVVLTKMKDEFDA